MVDLEIEEFTAETATRAGLVDAIKRGETKISGTYELTPEGYVEFEQNNFVFTDKNNNLRGGRFKDDSELLNFWSNFGFEIER